MVCVKGNANPETSPNCVFNHPIYKHNVIISAIESQEFSLVMVRMAGVFVTYRLVISGTRWFWDVSVICNAGRH